MQGHRQYECPARNRTFKAANVKCSICGEMSHPTRDCPQKDKSDTATVAAGAGDSAYLSFMAEVAGGECIICIVLLNKLLIIMTCRYECCLKCKRKWS